MLLAALRDGEDDGRARGPPRARRRPFARVPGTHLVRVQVLEPPARRWRGRPRPYLLLAAEHDGPAEPWLAAAARELDAVLAHCAFWPGADATPPRSRAGRASAPSTSASRWCATDATVEQIGAALRRQAGVRQMIAMGERP